MPEAPLSPGVGPATCLHRPWAVASGWRGLTSGRRSRARFMRPGPCFPCHSVSSTAFLPLPGPSRKNSFTPESQESVQFREMGEVYFLAAGGCALPSPAFSRKGGQQLGKQRQHHLTGITAVPATWRGFVSQCALFAGQTSPGLWPRKTP